ncbi:MAG: RNA polymerase subunit sigma-70 [Zetaproteobacteria bacterium]|nr:MAG: RNA polymerase subunit sigma-70 [Zetaproteobacteria bacterium]
MSSYTGTPESKPLPDLCDEDLMLVLQGGRDVALDELMHRHKKPLFYFACRYTRDEDDAYDIVQEAFIRVYTRAETYNPAYKFKTWLYQIALNLCRDYGRKKKLQSFFSLDSWGFGDDDNVSLHDIVASDENIESLTEHRQALKILEAQIDKLPHKLKTALIMFSLEDRSQEECARILDVTVKTVEMRVYRARKILLQKLSEKM